MWWSKESRRVQALEDDLAKLRREFQSLELEWSEAYDKLRRVVQRISKRAEILEKAESPGASLAGGDGADAAGTSLSARQQEINQRILSRRNRLGGQT